MTENTGPYSKGARWIDNKGYLWEIDGPPFRSKWSFSAHGVYEENIWDVCADFDENGTMSDGTTKLIDFLGCDEI